MKGLLSEEKQSHAHATEKTLHNALCVTSSLVAIVSLECLVVALGALALGADLTMRSSPGLITKTERLESCSGIIPCLLLGLRTGNGC